MKKYNKKSIKNVLNKTMKNVVNSSKKLLNMTSKKGGFINKIVKYKSPNSKKSNKNTKKGSYIYRKTKSNIFKSSSGLLPFQLNK